MNSSPTLLVYDDSVETSEVLAAVYQPRGYTVERCLVEHCTEFAEPASTESRSNTVVMLRSDRDRRSPEQPLRVLIGRVNESTQTGPDCQVAACRLSSLFDYRELVSAIDRLLCGSD